MYICTHVYIGVIDSEIRVTDISVWKQQSDDIDPLCVLSVNACAGASASSVFRILLPQCFGLLQRHVATAYVCALVGGDVIYIHVFIYTCVHTYMYIYIIHTLYIYITYVYIYIICVQSSCPTLSCYERSSRFYLPALCATCFACALCALCTGFGPVVMSTLDEREKENYMYVYMYVCMYICMYLCVYIYIHINIHIYIHIHIHIHIHIYVCI